MARFVVAPSIVAIVALFSRLPPPPTPGAEEGTDWVRIVLVAVLAISVAIVASLGLRPYFPRRRADEREEEEAGAPRDGFSEPPPTDARPAPRSPASAPPHDDEAGASDSPPATSGPDDAETMAGLTSLVRELLAYANAGDYGRGFALYTPTHLARFLAESGLDEAAVASLPPPSPEDRTELEALFDLESLEDDRIAATVAYTPKSGQVSVAERYVFARGAEGRWLVDDISPLM